MASAKKVVCAFQVEAVNFLICFLSFYLMVKRTWVPEEGNHHVIAVLDLSQVRGQVCVPSCSAGSHSATPCTVAYQAPLSMGFPRQEYCGVLLFPSPGDLPHPGFKPMPSVSPCIIRWILYRWVTCEAQLRGHPHLTALRFWSHLWF